MSDQAGTTARALYEQRCHQAMDRYHYNLTEYTRKTAYNQLIDDLLKCGDAYALGAEATRRRDRIRARDLDHALAQIRAQETASA